MTLADWTIYKVKRSGTYWQVRLQNAGATSRFENSKLFTDSFAGNQRSFVLINGVKTTYAGFQLVRNSLTKVDLFLHPKVKDYFYFPSFLSWNWDLSLDAWYPSSDNTFSVTNSGSADMIDPFELGSNPFTWRVKTVGALTSGRRQLVLEETAGVSTNKVLRYSQTFFLQNQIIFINNKQYRISTPGVRTSSSEITLYVFEHDYSPVALEAVTVPTLNAFYMEPTGDRNIFEDLFSKNSIPTGSLKIFYDFNSYEQPSAGGDYVMSVAPVSSGTYSGQIIGDFTQFSEVAPSEGYFKRKNYVKIQNADELFSRDFSFVFVSSKADKKPSTIFSNFGGYTNPTSGFAIGINSANKLYFQNYNELNPYISTLDTHNARKNIFCLIGNQNTVQMGRYDLEEGTFKIKELGLNPEFIRQSNNWYLGTGTAVNAENYNFEGYMDYFMYFNESLNIPQANVIASGFYNQMTGVVPIIRTIPGKTTGHEETLTGVTGIVDYSGVLSGSGETTYTGYALTGTGLYSTLTITGDYNLYITGDNYSGLYTQAILNRYELGRTGESFYSLPGATQSEASAIAYDPNRDLLILPKHDNSSTPFYEVDLEGNFKRSFSSNIDSVEAMCYMSGDYFAVGIEGHPSKIYYGSINKTTNNVDYNDWNSITLGVSWGSSKGLEGITFDQDRNCFYAVKEKLAGKGVYKVLFDGTTTHLFNPAYLDDLSDIYYDKFTDNLFLLSHDSVKISQSDFAGNELYQKPIPMYQPEGLTFTSDMKKMYVIGELLDQTVPYQPGGYFRLNNNLVNTYELLRHYTGFFSGNYPSSTGFQLDFYQEKTITGNNFSAITGFKTGVAQYTYTGYENIYVQSGITGYVSSGYKYTSLTGDPTGYLIENSGDAIVASSSVYEYFYDKVSYLLERSPDLVEYNHKIYDVSEPLTLDFSKKYNISAPFEYSSERRGNAFILNTDAEADEINLFFNGVAQHEGLLKTTQNDLYQNVYSTLTGDYSLIDSMIVNDKGFQTISRGEDEVIYDVSQASILRQTTGITNTQQWRDGRKLGISGDGVQVFMNGQKIYSGAHLDYVVREGFVSGQNFVTGITGDLSTYPNYTDLTMTTGKGLYDLTGRFLVDNVYYLNGIRQDPENFLVYPTGVSLMEGIKVELDGKQDIIYNRSRNYGD